MQIINFYKKKKKIEKPLSTRASVCSEASFNNENLYSANKRIIKKDKIKII